MIHPPDVIQKYAPDTVIGMLGSGVAKLQQGGVKGTELQRTDLELQRKDGELQRKDAELQRKDAELRRSNEEVSKLRSQLHECLGGIPVAGNGMNAAKGFQGIVPG